jgi:hypothetical protein
VDGGIEQTGFAVREFPVQADCWFESSGAPLHQNLIGQTIAYRVVELYR